jgi:DNA-binding NtrC family response regulator
MNGVASEKNAAAVTGINLRASLQEYETELIRQALRASDGNRRRAAALLELPLRTFERKLRKIMREADGGWRLAGS